ncbi:MFS transporter [Bacteroides sp. GM023]|uniref:MFS transporter n=1 Tax=Bacteroides sp. GM023 TaxID=2723058 RepID=UPI00168BA253|nr:MFS transporter [Bacteroides sp. GM023]MBD3589681.1 MFS transporter [Bacteroides sp. GM023]
MKKSLIALAFGTFGLGIAEFAMMGILGSVAESLQITITQAGHLISVYALGVCMGAPALLLVRKYPLKRILLLLAAIILTGNLFAAVAPDYRTLLIARIISGLPHGAYFGVASIVAQHLVRPGKGAQAVSMMMAGMTVSTVLGVPLGTVLSTGISWRLTFLLVALWGLVALLGICFWIPRLESLPDSGIKGQFRFLKSPAPWLIIGGTLLGEGGVYCWYSYIEPLLTQVSAFPSSSLTWLMVIAGLGMMAGNILSGRLADRFKAGMVAAVVQSCMVATLLLIFFFSSVPWLSVVLMVIGTAGLFGVGSPLQYLIIRFSKGGEMLGAASIQIAFNIGNAFAAWLGGLVLYAGYDYRYPALIGIPFALTGAGLLFVLHYKYECKS